MRDKSVHEDERAWFLPVDLQVHGELDLEITEVRMLSKGDKYFSYSTVGFMGLNMSSSAIDHQNLFEFPNWVNLMNFIPFSKI